MRLDAFLIADAASIVNGKIHIHGGGIGRIDAPLWPWTQPMLAVVVRFALEGQEFEVAHSAVLRLLDPEGETMLETGEMERPADAAPPASEGEQSFWDIVLGIGLLTFVKEGIYTWRLDLNGEVVRDFEMPIRRAIAAPAR